MSSKTASLASFIEAAPPGELSNVVADIKALTNDNSLQSLSPAFKKYNEEQFSTIKLPGSSESVIVSSFNALEDGRYFDPASQSSFAFDHTTQKVSGVQSYVLESQHSDLVKSLVKTLSAHAAEHYPSSSIGVYPIDNDSAIALVLVANKYSPNNFWNGRWRSLYTLNPSSGSLSGSLKVDVHYYEDGNVRLLTDKPVSISASTNASNIVRQIAATEKKYQQDLNTAFTNLSEGAFKSLRRQLPVTRQKVEWEKIGGYKLGQDIGGGRSRRPCYNHQKGRCKYGARCKFSHNLQDSSNKNDIVDRSQGKRHDKKETIKSERLSELHDWQNTVDKSTRVNISAFFQKAHDLVTSDPETRQEVIDGLASDNGLLKIQALAAQDFQGMSDGVLERTFLTQLVPFFQTITERQVLASPALEVRLGTIYTTVFGINGSRAERLLDCAVHALQKITSGGYNSGIVSPGLPICFEATLLLLCNILSMVGNAKLMPYFPIQHASLAACIGAMSSETSADFAKARDYLDRISQRLGLGSSKILPIADSSKRATVPSVEKAAFVTYRDGPGHLSNGKPRHDNDFEDIQKISIMPTTAEIFSPHNEYLPMLDSSTWHKQGLEGLLDRHFRLLREDTVGQLRDSINIELESLQAQGRPRVNENNANAARTYKYANARVEYVDIDAKKGMEFVISFDQPQQLRNKSEKQRRDWWEASRRLNGDALVCLLSFDGAPQETTVPDPPTYAQRRGFQYKLDAIGRGQNIALGSTLSLNPYKHTNDDVVALQQASTLDESQAAALIDSLTRSFALIQGPPGTGKSYTGIALVKVLLDNKKTARLGPILCVCYTNHALDQLLEHLLDDDVEQIIRMGSRSKSERLSELNLRKVALKLPRTRTENSDIWGLQKQLDKEVKAIKNLLTSIASGRSAKGLQRLLEETNVDHFGQLFGTMDEDNFKDVRHGDSNRILWNWLNGHFDRGGRPDRPTDELQWSNLHMMSNSERAALFSRWLSENFNKHIGPLNEVDLRVLNQADIIGVTTSGLARNLELLRNLDSKVLLCEEAGEVLESHLLTALLPSIEHAILIGDHQQLRPRINDYDLQQGSPRGDQYSLDKSLFERLVVPADGGITLPFSRLDTQRRMHPVISRLVKDTLYPTLIDAAPPYPEVAGMKQRLFWFDHKHPEAAAEQDALMAKSLTNTFEVEMTAALVSHLVKQGSYKAEDIAVLTPYRSQMRKLRDRFTGFFEIVMNDRDIEELQREGDESAEDSTTSAGPVGRKATLIQALRLATVDNFQGEEAKIVVISLVRSNTQHKVGFLKTPNRINVLLSRAQHGMYVIGNADTAKNITMWNQVLNILQETGSFGDAFELQCPRHKDTPLLARGPEDFSKISPEGGCILPCTQRLNCGHACPNRCHSQLLHGSVFCLEPCTRRKQGCDHLCPLPCGQPCHTKCQAEIKDIHVELPCGHVKTSLLCYQYQDQAMIVCQKPVERTVPLCGHKVSVPCHVDVMKESLAAEITTDVSITVQSHVTAKSPAHFALRAVMRGVVTPSVTSDAVSPVLLVPAPSAPRPVLIKLLKCGHQCPSVCGEPCPAVKYCQTCAGEDIKERQADLIMFSTYKDIDLNTDPCIFPKCGHFYTLNSMDGHVHLSEHYEVDENGLPVTLKLQADTLAFNETKIVCPDCRSSLRDVPRYGRVVRRAILIESTLKFITWSNSEYVPFVNKVLDEQKSLQKGAEFAKAIGQDVFLTGERLSQINEVSSLKMAGRYNKIITLRCAIAQFSNKVRQDEQPFKRVQEMVDVSRLRKQTSREFRFDTTILQTRAHLQATALLLRCDLIILSDVIAIRTSKGAVTEHRFLVNFDLNRRDCVELVTRATKTDSILQQAEGHILFARFAALELSRAHKEDSNLAPTLMRLKTEAEEHLSRAEALCAANPFQTRAVSAEIEPTRIMLNDGVFYTDFGDDELRAVIGAMAREFSGTGHWYRCENGHPFTVGECGMPMQTSRCPECGAAVGGLHHQAVDGVTHAGDLERRFAGLHVD
ncbi:hypothetical protein H2203_007920 [Taxawa tesnikishii (nom. ined.)]|nr:hypothetical protein H2203_007920 [Dothideales sp. JES 119]